MAQERVSRKWAGATWDLQAIFCKEVPNEVTGAVEDWWFWFVARAGTDEWFAHGLSRGIVLNSVSEMIAAIEPAVFDIMLPLGGQTWEVIEPYPVQHARLQRDLLATVRENGIMDELIGASAEEIRSLRWRGEAPNDVE